MARIRFVIGDPETGKTTQLELSEEKSRALYGKRIGDVIDGAPLGFAAYQFKITGGSDSDGTPMRPDVHGAVRKRLLLRGGVGFRPKNRGERRRRMVRGNEITDDIVQVNAKIVAKGKKPLLELVQKASTPAKE